jgi:sugar lactone lactonase YvrE
MKRRTAALSITAIVGLFAGLATPAHASTGSITGTSEIAHFDISTHQQPENLVLAPDGSVDLTFNRSREVGSLSSNGKLTILATLPQDAAGTAFVSGIVRISDGTLYVNYNAGSLSGIWHIPPTGGTPQRIVAIPTAGWLNGLGYDAQQNTLYATDSILGAVWKISLADDTASIWAQDTQLQPTTTTGIGANGLKIQDGAVWVSNTSAGTLLSIPISQNLTAGTVTVAAQGVIGIDDFAFTPNGDVVAAQNPISQASIIDPHTGVHTTVLTAANGLSNPTSVAVNGSSVYIASGAYLTGTDPNLLEGTLVE